MFDPLLDYRPASSRICCAELYVLAGVPGLAYDGPALSVSDMLASLAQLPVGGAVLETCESIEELSLASQREGVVALVDAGVLWGNAAAWSGPTPNHAVRIVAVQRESADSPISAVRIADPARPSQEFQVDVTTLVEAWLKVGGLLVVRTQAKKISPAL